MYLRDVWACWRRRWYLAIVGLLLTVLACVLLAAKVTPEYESKASVVLIPPKSTEDPLANRYLGLGGLSASVDVLARSMSSDETTRDLQKQAPRAEYEVVSDTSTSAPIISITTSSKERAQAQRLLGAVLARLPVNLVSLQETLGITSNHQITIVAISKDAKPTANQKTRIRILGVATIGLLFLFTVLIAAVDGLLLRRTPRLPSTPRRESAEQDEDEEGPEELDTPGEASDGRTPAGDLPTVRTQPGVPRRTAIRRPTRVPVHPDERPVPVSPLAPSRADATVSDSAAPEEDDEPNRDDQDVHEMVGSSVGASRGRAGDAEQPPTKSTRSQRARNQGNPTKPNRSGDSDKQVSPGTEES